MINIEDLQKAINSLKRYPKPLKKIKVTGLFAYYIATHIPAFEVGVENYQSFISDYAGIPIEIDDEIDGHYKLIY